ncbi:MAG: alpha/beta fold hydrolase [Candidatus Binatia bacterium]
MDNPKYVEIDRTRTRYFDEGEGESLVLFHGGHFGANDNIDLANNWDRNWPWLVKSFHVYAPDKLGQGFTDLPRTDNDYTIAAVIQHAYHFIRAMGLNKVHLVGHSRGGYLVTRLTLEHPELVNTLVIVDSSTTSPGENPHSDAERDQGRRGRLLADAPKPLLTKESLRWVTEAFSYTKEHITDDWINIRHEVGKLSKTVESIKKMSKLSSAVFLPHIAKQKEETHSWIREGRLKTPTLLVWGKNDPSAVISGGLALFDMVAASTKRAQMHIFNQAGHYSYREHPEDFARVLTSFIKGGKVTGATS